MARNGGSWTSRWPSRPDDDPDREPDGTHRRSQHDRGSDDREVVHARRHRGGREPSARVEHAGRHGAEGQEDRAEHHDPGQLDRAGQGRRVEAARVGGHDDVGTDEDDDAEHRQGDEHEVRDRRHHAPRALFAVALRDAREDRDERGRQRPRRHELEHQVGQAERGEERVELGGGKGVADDHEADPAEHAGEQERPRDDHPGAGQRPGRRHGASPRRARGCASR